MNRLAPLIVRRPAPPAPRPILVAERGAAPPSTLRADIRLFLVSYIAGLIFFGTLFA